MKLLRAGINLIKSHEGCALTAYLDGGGLPTIAFGHTQGVKLGDICTSDEADAWLKQDLDLTQAQIKHFIPDGLTDQEFSALVSLVYNIGIGNFAASTVLQKIKINDMEAAADAMLMWQKIDGKPSNGLLARRKAERDLFLS